MEMDVVGEAQRIAQRAEARADLTILAYTLVIVKGLLERAEEAHEPEQDTLVVATAILKRVVDMLEPQYPDLSNDRDA